MPFLFAAADGDHGRRMVQHEYSGRDIPYFEDMGRKSRRRTIEAFVLEPDHIGKVARLIEACEEAGPGTLVHPYLGALQVVCTSCRQKFTTRDGGMASFTLQFAEAGENRFPTPRTDSAAAAAAAGDDALAAIKQGFEQGFDVPGLPDFVADDAAARLGEAVTLIQNALQPSRLAGSGLASFARNAASMTASAADLVRTPATLADRLTSLMRPAGVRSPWQSFVDVADFGTAWPTVPQTTASRIRQLANRTALGGLVRAAALVEAGISAASATFETFDDAVGTRDTIADRLDVEMATADDAAYLALQGHRATVVRAVSARAPSLPRLVDHTPTTVRPSLVLAHELYGDDLDALADRAAEIATRNRIRHPGLVPAGTLKVLTDGR